ncbi:hypothetical protein GQ53DRAFT_828031 [Thozetella sp. PMI_491]|nr:hypothetical protein GQ53DRAFT_828031 [Thozetella sp. PMI_491]
MHCRTLALLLGILAPVLVRALPGPAESTPTTAPEEDLSDYVDEGPYTFCATCPLLGTERIVQILPTITPGQGGFLTQTIPIDERKYTTLGPEAWKHRPKFTWKMRKSKQPQATGKPNVETEGK